jgi:O-antigen ligase
MMLGAALFSYAIAIALTDERARVLWLAIAGAVLFGYLITGTRTSLVFLAAPLAILVGARRGFARRSGRLLLVIPLIALLIGLGTVSFVERTSADREVLESRIELLLSTGDTSDLSFVSRQAQGEAAWAAFAENPIFGIGAGVPFEWRDPVEGIVRTVDVDSPFGYVAKFGFLGLAPLALLIWSFVRFLQRSREKTGERTVAQFALIGFAGVFVAFWTLGAPFADKGLASGFLLLLALALNELAYAPNRAPAGTAA